MCMLRMPPAIASNAIGGSIAVGAALLSCLTLLPAFLAGFPSLFASPEDIVARQEWEGLVAHSVSTGQDSLVVGATIGSEARKCQHASWYLWAVMMTSFPVNVLVIVCLCVAFAPTALKLRTYSPAVDNFMCLPPHGPAVLAQQELRRDFQGKAEIYIMVEAQNGCFGGVQSNGYFNASCRLANDLLSLGRDERPMKSDDLLGVSFFSSPGQTEPTCIHWRNERYSEEEVAEAEKGNFTPSAHLLLTGRTSNLLWLPGETLMYYRGLYQQLWARCASDDNRASLVVVALPWELFSWQGFELIEDLRMLLSRPKTSDSSRSGEIPDVCQEVKTREISEASIWRDYIFESVGALPNAIGIACLVTTPFIAVSFWSVVAPLKLLLTVALPLTWVFGAAVEIFQDGALGTPKKGLHWTVPCSTSMLLLALALDYNIFYFGRVYEFRKAGLSDIEAIRQGLASTGPVITCAGLIFALEFSGLFFSEAAINRQGGFVVVVGVLLDTFVVRSCLMPAALSLGAQWNW
ncbi:unnamed protein product [Polarella glacialis]|uniref:Membrane transport protein MMPL domain-containing protein n=1 Tax=Polarella glacialis TaxID=89957 RepID=A0A813GF50_POLGL|nr:unnamed protein product [Polarella glacialis]CAE8625796.1 unnamed protein product [Polarella glacialis]